MPNVAAVALYFDQDVTELPHAELGHLLMPMLADGRRAIMRIKQRADWERARQDNGDQLNAIVRDEISGRRFEISRVGADLHASEVF